MRAITRRTKMVLAFSVSFAAESFHVLPPAGLQAAAGKPHARVKIKSQARISWPALAAAELRSDCWVAEGPSSGRRPEVRFPQDKDLNRPNARCSTYWPCSNPMADK